jgi:nitrate reductase gamma subunit
MDLWLDLMRGPIFRFSFVLMILGLFRHAILTGIGIRRIVARAGNPAVSYKAAFRATLLWLFPFKKLNNRILYSITSVIFHIGLIITPIFLAAHILLWSRGIGLSWPGISENIADVLTIITIISGLGLLIGRAASRNSRAISRFQDFFLPVLLIIPFLSGLLAGHPTLNPFSYQAMMLIHVMSGNLIFILIPFTKLAHAILMPTTQLVSEAAWHFPAGSGVDVALALQKEVQEV